MTDAFKNKNGNYNTQMLWISLISCSSENHSNCYMSKFAKKGTRLQNKLHPVGVNAAHSKLYMN